ILDDPLLYQEFGVEDSRARCAADRVVAERHKPVIKYVIRKYPSHGYRHSLSTVAVQPRLRTRRFVEHLHEFDRRRIKVQNGKRFESFDNILKRRSLFQIYTHRRRVTVDHVHAKALGRNGKISLYDRFARKFAQYLLRFR